MRSTIPIALAVVLSSVPALAQPKAKPAPRAKPPAAAPQPKSGSRGFSFSFSTARGRLGANVTSMTEELRGYFGAPKDAGVLVQRVEPGTPAAKAGLKVGDVVTRVGGTSIESAGDVSMALLQKKAGDVVSVGVVRAKRFLQLNVKLDSDPADDGDFDFSIEGLGDLFKGFGSGKSQGFFKQWHWQWPPDASSGSGSSDPSQFDKRLRELEKRYQELQKKGSGGSSP